MLGKSTRLRDSNYENDLPTVARLSGQKPLSLFFVPSKAVGEDLHLAPAVVRLHEDRQLSVSPFPLQYCGGRRDQIAVLFGPALNLEIRGQFGANALHVRLAFEKKVLNSLLVIDVGRIFREGQVLDVEFILRRLRRGFFAELGRRRGGYRLVRCVLSWLFRIGDLKLFRDLSKRRDKLEIDLPGLAEHFGLAIGGQFSLHFAIRKLEVVCLDLADRAKALLLMRGVDNLAAKDVAVLMERDDQCAAALAEPGIKVGLLILGMIFFSEHQHDRRLTTKGLAPMCRHVSDLRLLAVPLEYARHRGLHVGCRARLFFDGSRQRFPSAEQRYIETDVKARGKHFFGLIRLAGFTTHPAVLQL